MTRRKHPPPKADPDDYGFNVAGKGFRGGDVRECSYYRCLQILACAPSPRGGPRLASPTKDQLRRAIERLVQAGLIVTRWDDNRRDGALQIWVVSGAGGTSKWTVSPGVGPRVKGPETRMNTH